MLTTRPMCNYILKSYLPIGVQNMTLKIYRFGIIVGVLVYFLNSVLWRFDIEIKEMWKIVMRVKERYGHIIRKHDFQWNRSRYAVVFCVHSSFITDWDE